MDVRETGQDWVCHCCKELSLAGQTLAGRSLAKIAGRSLAKDAGRSRAESQEQGEALQHDLPSQP